MPPLWFANVGCGIVNSTRSVVASATFGSADTRYSAITIAPSATRV
jgi:hypothetical protein